MPGSMVCYLLSFSWVSSNLRGILLDIEAESFCYRNSTHVGCQESCLNWSKLNDMDELCFLTEYNAEASPKSKKESMECGSTLDPHSSQDYNFNTKNHVHFIWLYEKYVTGWCFPVRWNNKFRNLLWDSQKTASWNWNYKSQVPASETIPRWLMILRCQKSWEKAINITGVVYNKVNDNIWRMH